MIKEYQKKFEEETPYSFVILDLTVEGGMGGLETIKKLHKIDSGVSAIINSGYAKNREIKEYKKYGFKSFLKKPFTIDNLIKSIIESLKSE